MTFTPTIDVDPDVYEVERSRTDGNTVQDGAGRARAGTGIIWRSGPA